MAPKWAKKDLDRLRSSMRVLREEDRELYDEVIDQHAGTIAALFLEPRHAIQQRSAQQLARDVKNYVAEALDAELSDE
jgi:hypothetical protein